ncbi:MAG: family 78 glycoside hydrolase catalytic domain [Planctomycetota bacterium]|jgi:alpha-L-rhamnosidase
MNRIKLILTIFIVFLLLSSPGCTEQGKGGKAQAFDIAVVNLRCEYLANPMGIDITKPRLSWILKSGQRSSMQSAYHILVASSVQTLEQNKGDLWNSRKVKSDRSNQIVYKGKTLKSRMPCYWKVRVWDQDGRVSPWSKPARWTMGLLESEDWQAKWIGYDAEPPEIYKQQQTSDQLDLKGGKWIWFDEGDPVKSAPIDTRFFRNSFEIASDKSIKRARFALLVDNQATVFVNGQEAGQLGGWQSVHIVDVTDKLVAGTNTLAIAVANVGDAANPAGLTGKLFVEFESEGNMVVLIDDSWKASDAEQDGWQTPGFDDSAWPGARVIAQLGDNPWKEPSQEGLVLPPPPYLRKSFVVNKPVKRAVVYASALGLYELQINGMRVGEDYFTPGWTDYTKRVYYQSYDVTNMLTKSGNTIGAILADGWYAGYLGFGRKREHYGSEPRLFVQLEVEYTDGTRQTIATDETWKAAYGPLFESDFLMGETYDSREEIKDWCKYWFDDTGWDEVAVTGGIEAEIQAYPGVTVKKILKIEPKEITEPKKNAYVFDMGQNYAGWVRLKTTAQAGTKIVLRFAEMLNPDGTIYTTNLRAARCTDTYICKGNGEETWEPRFTFHGFRYVEITGYPGKPPLDTISGVVLQSDTPLAGAFECSNPMVNQLYKNIVWGQRGNFIEVPTDCPQRDERLGWTGDAQIFIRTATYNMDVAAFFTKWLVDLEDAQGPEGGFPDVAPRKVAMGDGTAAWGDAGVICPYTIYEVYGDKRVIERHFESMKKWISYLKTNSKGLLRPDKGYGDWVSIASNTPKDVIGTAYFAYSTRLLSKMAAAIGRDDEAKEYEELFEQIKAAFNEAYVSEDARIKGDTQTCYLLGLHFDLLAADKREQAAEHLVERIEAKNWHLSTGFVGLSYLLPTLTETGNLDVAYRLLFNDTFPSWGYSIKNGATTIWERWDGWTKEKGFQDPGMNSFNHYAFGSVGRWLFNTVAGIDTDGPGYKKIIIRPMPGAITRAAASYDSVNGRIVSNWQLKDGTFTLNVVIPANTTATVYIPAESAKSITESGRPATSARGVQFLHIKQRTAVFTIGSGNYQFESKVP